VGIKRRVLVTGANGYIGAQIVKGLIGLGYEIIAHLRNENEGFLKEFENLQMIYGDIIEDSTINQLSELDLDSIIHTISLDHNQSNEAGLKKLNDINVHATWRLLEANSQKKVKFIYLSTIHVLGRIEDDRIDEASLGFPANRYGLTHLLCEDLVDYYAKNYPIDAVSVRLSNGFGSPVFEENNCWWIVVNDFCRSAIEKGEIKMSSDGSPVRNFIHLNDIVQGIAILLNDEKRGDWNYHLTSHNTYTIMETAQIVQRVCAEVFNLNVNISLPDTVKIGKARPVEKSYPYTRLEQLGYEPTITLEKGVEELIEYLIKQ